MMLSQPVSSLQVELNQSLLTVCSCEKPLKVMACIAKKQWPEAVIL